MSYLRINGNMTEIKFFHDYIVKEFLWVSNQRKKRLC